MTLDHDLRAARWLLTGGVQGVGLRPAVAGLAESLGLAGRIANRRDGLLVELEGPAATLERFERELPAALPPAAQGVAWTRSPRPVCGGQGIAIETCEPEGPLATRVPPDRAACRDCLDEVADPGNRRYGHPFASCLACGPRYTILRAMPYERERTTLGEFALCPECQVEYAQPGGRRRHAQTVSCHACGPQVWASDASGAVLALRQAAVERAIRALRGGQVVAVRGVGGYQLLADATDDGAVNRVRAGKGRPNKPLAVMAFDREAAERLGIFGEAAVRSLVGPENPIVVVPQRPDSGLAATVSRGLPSVGLFLPATPLHALLLRGVGQPLVATSGNREGEPLTHEPEEALAALAGADDLWLHHNRPIAAPLDDSLVLPEEMGLPETTVRLARGYAPWPLELPATTPLLATGGHQKAAVALSNGTLAVLGPHIGDLETVASRERFVAEAARLQAVFACQPHALVHDLHPDYFTTRWARAAGAPTVAVQHHHAHAVAAMLEHGWLEREVLALACDGSGYGPDGTIWGGELLRATPLDYRRIGALRPFALVGRERAIREPWRVAAVLLADSGHEAAARAITSRAMPEGDRPFWQLRAGKRAELRTTSAGRLFDGAAALILDWFHAAYEGEPAQRLEACCATAAEWTVELPRTAAPHGVELDWRPLFARLLEERARGAPAESLSACFHASLARGLAALCAAAERLPIVLCGGVFQNRRLTAMLAEELHRAGRMVGLPGRIPVNDGGLAAGQLAVAACRAAARRAT